LNAGDGTAEDEFGVAVALSHDTAVVGAYRDNGATGSAYVFVRNGDEWILQDKLSAGDATTGDYFGFSVSIEDDVVMVGAYGDDTPAGVDAGSVSVFLRNAGHWQQQAKLVAADAAAGDYFGASVALSGGSALMGAVLDDGPGGNQSGSAYVFVGSGGNWNQQAKLTAHDATTEDRFGYTLALEGDTALVGAYADDTARGADAGSA